MASNANPGQSTAKTPASGSRRGRKRNALPDLDDSADTGAGGVASVDRALQILGAFSTADPALGLVEIADRTGLYKSTILRLSQSLIRARLLARRADGRYCVGPMGLTLAAAYQASHSLGDVMMPIMNRIAKEFGESVAFYVLEGDSRICLFRVDGPRLLRHHVRQGETLPLTSGSGGHVLAAFGGAQGAQHEHVRQTVWHVSYGDRDPEIAGLSVPIFGPNATLVGAITVSGPITRITESFVQHTIGPLLRYAIEATEALGGDLSELQRAWAVQDGKAEATPTFID